MKYLYKNFTLDHHKTNNPLKLSNLHPCKYFLEIFISILNSNLPEISTIQTQQKSILALKNTIKAFSKIGIPGCLFSGC